jgi:hypothetical protein
MPRSNFNEAKAGKWLAWTGELATGLEAVAASARHHRSKLAARALGPPVEGALSICMGSVSTGSNFPKLGAAICSGSPISLFHQA